MHLVYCIDETFFDYLLISIKTLISRNRGNNIIIYIIHNYKTINKSQLLNIYENINFIYYENNDINFYVNSRLPKLVYYRLFLAEILPLNIKKCLYLDADTIILSNLTKLYNTDLSDYVYGGVLDLNVKYLTEEYRYINSGVLLINLDKIRKNDIIKDYKTFINNNSVLDQHDQTIINSVNKNQIKYFPLEYNVNNSICFSPMSIHLMYELMKKQHFEVSASDVFESFYRPKIIHFIKKPIFYDETITTYEELLYIYLEVLSQ